MFSKVAKIYRSERRKKTCFTLFYNTNIEGPNKISSLSTAQYCNKNPLICKIQQLPSWSFNTDCSSMLPKRKRWMKKFGFASPCFSNSEKLLCTVIYILACGTEIHHQHFPFPTCQHHANTTGIAVIIFFVWRLCYNCIRHFRMFFLSKSVCDLPFIYFQGLILQLGLQLESGEWQNISKKKILQYNLENTIDNTVTPM